MITRYITADERVGYSEQGSLMLKTVDLYTGIEDAGNQESSGQR